MFEEYSNRITQLLNNSDLSLITPKQIRHTIQQEFNTDLSSQRLQFKQYIYSLLDTINSQENTTNDPCSSISSPVDIKPEPQFSPPQDILHDHALAMKLQAIEDSTASRTTRQVKSKPTKPKKSTKSTKNPQDSSKKTGFQRLYHLSPQLSTFLNPQTSSRPDVVKFLWNYIKSLNLQDPKDKRFIKCDENMKSIMGKNRVHMMEMNKILSKHIKSPVETSEKDVISDEDLEILDESSSKTISIDQKTKNTPKKKREVSKKNPFNRPMMLSNELKTVLGHEMLPRPQVVKKLWEYIKEKNLQDPKDKRNIFCDDLLFAVFKVKKVNCFGMNGMLSKHLTKIEGEIEDPSELVISEESQAENSSSSSEEEEEEEEIQESSEQEQD